jgi:PPOX class probable F420-dependent enzyme
MAATPEPQVRGLIEGANFAHVATLMPDGSPHSVAVWAGMRGDHLYFFTQPESRKARNLEGDGRVAISVVDRANPYRTGHIRGRVAEVITGDDALELIDELSLKYTGAPFPMRSGQVYLVEPEVIGFMELPFEETPPVG